MNCKHALERIQEAAMEENKSSTRIHPLTAGAAISVMLVSLTGVAAITGLIPSSHSTSAPTSTITASNASAVATAATSPAALVEEQEEAEPAAKTPSSRNTQQRNETPRVAEKSQSRPAYKNSTPVAQAPSICVSCGRVESVQAVQQQGQASGVGVVAGAVVGGLLGNQVGGGNGRKLATVAGAVGGGYAGNEIEKRSRSTTSYQVRVRMEDGSVRTFPYAQQPSWGVGDRVKVVDGKLTSRA
jgi:outer membrane lipoprotein SlyB